MLKTQWIGTQICLFACNLLVALGTYWTRCFKTTKQQKYDVERVVFDKKDWIPLWKCATGTWHWKYRCFGRDKNKIFFPLPQKTRKWKHNLAKTVTIQKCTVTSYFFMQSYFRIHQFMFSTEWISFDPAICWYAYEEPR